jgi:hypothetical protein
MPDLKHHGDERAVRLEPPRMAALVSYADNRVIIGISAGATPALCNF